MPIFAGNININMTEKAAQAVNYQTAKQLGLLEEEFDKIRSILGRDPNFTELSIYSVMWSEHCSYKNSIKYIKQLPRKGKKLLVEAGEENAGLVDIGNGWACAFKIESHNHPSAIEPYQGAATGVGGIHRDIFTMGARPIAALNSLRFGDLGLNHTKKLVKGVVHGIGDYGNCLGVPTIGGEVYFNECYNQNILVNAMSIGLVKHGETVSAVSKGVGNPVFIVGSATGKDGIHGATFASADLTEDSAEDLPAVQVGDPFQEKLLLEATLEAIKSCKIVGMQDMGAAGIICSTSEMSAKGESGMVIYLDKVPTRQQHMKPFEILLSESQERMLVVVEKGEEENLRKVYEKWDLECSQIGEVTDTGFLEFFMDGELVAHVPAETLVLGGGAPVYDRSYEEPRYMQHIRSFSQDSISQPDDLYNTALKLMASPNLVSKKWIYEQYDSMVRTNTLTTNSPADAAIIRVKGTDTALFATTDCNGAYVYADPFVGGMIAVAEAARNVVCSGGVPVAITNCLNFGNPYNPEVYYQFVYALKGMGEACRKFDTPVTGGNVSFYNQSDIKGEIVPVFPTPTIGMLGISDDSTRTFSINFKNPGDKIYIIGDLKEDLGSSEYLRTIHKVLNSPAPYFDLEAEYKLQQALIAYLKEHKPSTVHDVSDGGLFANLMESAITGNLGFKVDGMPSMRKDAFWFGEAQSRVVISVDEEEATKLEAFMNQNGIALYHLGEVTEGSIHVDGSVFGSLNEWRDIYYQTLDKYLSND